MQRMWKSWRFSWGVLLYVSLITGVFVKPQESLESETELAFTTITSPPKLCVSPKCLALYDSVFKADIESKLFAFGTTVNGGMFEVLFDPDIMSVPHVTRFLCDNVGLDLSSDQCIEKGEVSVWVEGALMRRHNELRAREVALALALTLTSEDVLVNSSSFRTEKYRHIISSWYNDEQNKPSSSTSTSTSTSDDMLSLTFIIPAKNRPLLLLKTLLNLYGKATHKDRLFARVVLYADDTASLQVIPLLAAISPNIDVRINTHVELGYDQIERLYNEGAHGVQTTLQAVFTDRQHILTTGFDAHIYQAYANLQRPALAVLYMHERNTWRYSYPIQTTRLARLVGGYHSPSIDGFLKYLGQCSGIIVHVKEVTVWRQHVQPHEVFKTSQDQASRKEEMFRQSGEMKSRLLEACAAVLQDEEYVELDSVALGDVQLSWLQEPYILNGPTGFL